MSTSNPSLNLFATVLTHAAPSSNYRGESEQNRTVLQKITRGEHQYAIVSADSIRNAMRETLAQLGFPCNRVRIQDAGQLAVSFENLPNPDQYADDWAFGYMVADEKKYGKNMSHPTKRDSIMRLNTAVALAPYRFEASLHQSPKNVERKPRTKVFWLNSKESALLHREASYTAFQYPVALCGRDCQTNPEWTKGLLQAIAQLNNVAGAHARSYFEFAPRSLVVRLTPKLVAGFDTYGFDETGNWRELSRLNDQDLPAQEFWLGGDCVRQMSEEKVDALEQAGAHLYQNPDRLLDELTQVFLGDSDRATT
ncbi:MAG: type I-B CRISPR-associated protein Cas7/Cst2/DevR [Phormidium sp.]